MLKKLLKFHLITLKKKIKDHNELINKKKLEDKVQDTAPSPQEDKTNINKCTTMIPEKDIGKMS